MSLNLVLWHILILWHIFVFSVSMRTKGIFGSTWFETDWATVARWLYMSGLNMLINVGFPLGGLATVSTHPLSIIALRYFRADQDPKFCKAVIKIKGNKNPWQIKLDTSGGRFFWGILHMWLLGEPKDLSSCLLVHFLLMFPLLVHFKSLPCWTQCWTPFALKTTGHNVFCLNMIDHGRVELRAEITR